MLADKPHRLNGTGHSIADWRGQVSGLLQSEMAKYKAALDLAIERGWRELHESGTYVRLLKTEAARALLLFL
jgi:hypothetical protein